MSAEAYNHSVPRQGSFSLLLEGEMNFQYHSNINFFSLIVINIIIIITIIIIFIKADKRTAEWPLVNSPWPIVTIIVSYVYFVKVFGPNWMKDRKPFKIEPIICCYNILMIILSAFFFIEGGRLSYFSGKYSLKCQPVDVSYSDDAIRLVHLCWWFMVLKIVEFADTIFFVLKKNNRQISNLHVIHHTLVVIGLYVGTRYGPGGHGIFFALINSLVHVIMYSYYLLAAMGPKVRKYLWWKKYLTQFQMVSFTFFDHSMHIQLFLNFSLSPGSIYSRWYS